MKVFISYGSEQREFADRLRGALVAEGDTVFQDREQISVGEAFHKRIRMEISRADVFVFLATKDSTTTGSYPLSELKQAERLWPNPEGKVFVSLLNGFPPDQLPGYLGSVSAHLPTGDAVADMLAELALIRETRIGSRLFVLRFVQGVVAGMLALLVLFAAYEAVYREILYNINSYFFNSSTGAYETPAWIGSMFHDFLPPSVAAISCAIGVSIAIRGVVGRGTIALVIATPVALTPAIYLALESIRYNAGYGTAAYSAKIGVGAALALAIVSIIVARTRRHWRGAIRHRSNAA